jgi:ABC-type transport system involved in multi-copper enzyme maturation permease subunit
MDATAASPKKPVAINRWLPYWAVFQADVGLTFQSWVYRVWIALVLMAAAGGLAYRLGLQQEAGVEQPQAKHFSSLLQGAVLASIAFVVVLAASSINSERATMADSILSRGISRRQYFLGKWHARLVTVLGAYLTLSVLALTGSLFLHADVTFDGSLVALATIGALLAVVVSAGVMVSAVTSNTLLGVALLWAALYGGGYALSWLNKLTVTPDLVLARLPHILRGNYDLEGNGVLIGWCAGVSCVMGLVGMVCFSRRDV